MSDLGAVRPRKTPAKRTKSVRPGKPGMFRTMLRRIRMPALTGIVSAGFAAIMVGIVLNAMVFQKGRHPAPLFGAALVDGAMARPAPPPPVRLQAAAPAQPQVGADPADAEPAPAPAPVAHPAHAQPAAHAAAPVHAKPVDRIAQLLNGSAVAPEHSAKAGVPKVATKVRPGQHAANRPRPAATATE
jgi:hypothetical protein